MKVKIVKCSDDIGWWKRHIGGVVDIDKLFWKDEVNHTFVPTDIKYRGSVDFPVFKWDSQRPWGLVSDNSPIIPGGDSEMQFYIDMDDVVSVRELNIKELGI